MKFTSRYILLLTLLSLIRYFNALELFTEMVIGRRKKKQRDGVGEHIYIEEGLHLAESFSY